MLQLVLLSIITKSYELSFETIKKFSFIRFTVTKNKDIMKRKFQNWSLIRISNFSTSRRRQSAQMSLASRNEWQRGSGSIVSDAVARGSRLKSSSFVRWYTIYVCSIWTCYIFARSTTSTRVRATNITVICSRSVVAVYWLDSVVSVCLFSRGEVQSSVDYLEQLQRTGYLAGWTPRVHPWSVNQADRSIDYIYFGDAERKEKLSRER